MQGVAVVRDAQTSASSSLGLPPDLLSKGRERVGQLALLLIVLAVVAQPLNIGFRIGAGVSAPALLVPGLINLALLVALWLTARSRSLADETVLKLALAGEIAICLLINVGSYWSDVLHLGRVSYLTFAEVLMVGFPMLVPVRPRHALWASLGCAATAPLALGGLEAAGVLDAPVIDYLGVSIYPGFAVAFAVFGSKVLHGISQEVVKARELGSYQLDSMLGQGAMGEVWKARHRLLSRPAAIKLIKPEFLHRAGEPEREGVVLERFRREAEVTARLCSPNTVQLYDFGEAEDGTLYTVMELLDGIDLQKLVRRFGAQPEERVVSLLLQACHSLEEAHHNELVHRDLKPANMLLCRYGLDYDHLKVLDFGLAGLRAQPGGDARLTHADMLVGTPAFMAPEQVKDSLNVDGRADIYALGCVAWYLLSGRLVFDVGSAVEMIGAQLHTQPEPLSRVIGRALSPGLEELVMACLAKDPAGRPQTVAELVAGLRRVRHERAWTPERARAWWGELAHEQASARAPTEQGPDDTEETAIKPSQ